MDKLFQKLNINPNNRELYEIAFSHSSYANEHKKKTDYERLEFLGDAVLELVLSDFLYSSLDFNEGKMTKLRSSYVCENALYRYALDLGLNEYIKVGHGELVSGGLYKKTIVADTFESFLGAIYIDLGFEKAKNIILDIIVPYIEDPNINFFSDYKSILQEAVQTIKKSVIYNLIEESGPPHDKLFTVEVKIDGISYGKGVANSKKEAEKEAAKSALELLARKK
ncbi:MAG: ribonuclease III [Tenericutes bacterium]|jgi:ribonuclease-3|nr:ribonuclease III [Mycoplasmatota bacterium]